MSNHKPVYSAKAFDEDGNETGVIEDVPIGNVDEFLAAHMTGTPWEPETEADRVEVQRGDSFDE